MNRASRPPSFVFSVLILAAVCGTQSYAVEPDATKPSDWWRTGEFVAAEAKQAAAADDKFVYVVTNDKVVKYDRDGKRWGESSGAAKHLNSAFFADGFVYCAHSNYPQKPERSEIRVLDPHSMRLGVFHDFGNYGGSLTWAVKRDDAWWCCFAHYGDENRRTFLARFDMEWKETGRWTFPAEALERIGKMSFSGGIWRGDALLVSDHDHPRLYELRLPTSGDVLEFVAEHEAELTGQGFAADPATGGLIGIDRARKLVVFLEYAK